MQTNPAGLAILKDSEGCRLQAYLCPAGKWTCGWGQTGPDIGPDTEWTQEQADERLAAALGTFERGVARMLRVPVTGNQFSALVCLAYNIGLGNLLQSTLMRRINAGDVAGAADEFPKWSLANGQRLPGLVRRRERERALFLHSDEVV